MLNTLLTVAMASLVGSLHCAAMCGGLVSFTCGTSESPRLAQVVYHGSRLVVYAGLGAVAGYVGQSLNRHIDVTGYQNLTGLATGGAMIGWALFSLLRRWRAKSSPAPVARSPLVALAARKPRTNRLSTWFARLHTLPSVLRGALLGLTSAVLPCGWLYAFVTAAAGRGAPGAGALVMTAFWLGTLPMLLGLGGLVSLLGGKAQRYLPQVSVVVLLALGLGTIAFRQPGAHAAGASTQPPNHHSCH
jgi:uncharacterized protein